MTLSDNETQIILSLIAIAGTCLNFYMTSVLSQRQRKTRAKVEKIEEEKPPNTEDVIALYATAEKSLEAINKLLRKHGRTVQVKAERMSQMELMAEGEQPPQESRPTVKRSLRRTRAHARQ